MNISKKDVLALVSIAALIFGYLIKEDGNRSWILMAAILCALSWILWKVEERRRSTRSNASR